MAETDSSGQTLRQVSRATARVLTSPVERQFLEPFLGQTRSVGDVAAHFQLPISHMYYRVQRLLQLGLLVQAGDTVRERHRVKLYTASATSFFIPFALTPFESLGQLLNTLGAAKTFTEHAALTLQELAEAWGVLIYQRQPQGDLFVSIAPVGQTGAPLPLQASQVLSPEFPALWSSEDVLSLDFETAKQLQNELAQLVGRYKHKTPPRSGGYFLLLGLTPLLRTGHLESEAHSARKS